MPDKLYTFKIPVSWAEYGDIYIEAKNLDNAIKQTRESPLPDDGEYMDGSFEIDVDMVEECNEKVLEQIENDKNPLNDIVEKAFPKTFNITGEK